jgi:hypothetical protein
MEYIKAITWMIEHNPMVSTGDFVIYKPTHQVLGHIRKSALT